MHLLIAAAVVAASLTGGPPQVARWDVTTAGAKETGLSILSGGDGVTEQTEMGGASCFANKADTTPRSSYMYFQLPTKPQPDGPLYVTVEFYDGVPGGSFNLEYDTGNGDTVTSRYRPAEDQAGGFCNGSKRWTATAFLLKTPGFAHRQNQGADFRLSGTQLFVRSVVITSQRPSNWDSLNNETPAQIKPLVHIGAGGQLIIGGFDVAKAEDAPRTIRSLRAAIPAMKALGVTSHEAYVRWNLCEPAEGRYDWSIYDHYVDEYKRAGLKWVPFLIVGSAYTLPDWYYKKPGSQGYICLEHNQESDVQSLWNPTLRQHVARFIRAFCEHYRDSGVIESILLGVTGNYGEAIYPASGNDWTADIHGLYHTHAGMWAGDPYAVASFREWLQAKYKTDDGLKAAWGAQAPTLAAVRTFLRDAAPSDRAWLDQAEWYIGSMTSWSRFWLRETRAAFPKGGIYLCTGGHAPIEHGSDFGEQCRIAAEVHGGVRITNEASDERANFSLTRWVASAARQYGAYFSFEPAGEVTPDGVPARVYNASTSGALGLHYYYPNLFASEEAYNAFVHTGSQFQQRTPVLDVAVYYPETYIQLRGADFLGLLQPLRDRFDFGYMSDKQILTGGLKRVKALIILKGNIAEAAVWKTIAEWVRSGGVLIAANAAGKLRTVEGDDTPNTAVLQPSAGAKGRVVMVPGRVDTPAWREAVTRELAAAPELPARTRAMIASDGEENRVFVSLCEPDELVWLNANKDAQHRAGVDIPPHSIVTTKTPAR